MIEAILVTTGALYLLYNAYNIKYKHIIRKNDNALTAGKNITDIEGYCNWYGNIMFILGILGLVLGVVFFVDTYFFKFGYWLYGMIGIVLVVYIGLGIHISKNTDKYCDK